MCTILQVYEYIVITLLLSSVINIKLIEIMIST